MKKLLFLFALLLAGNTAFAQDYAPLPDIGIRRYFTNSAGYLRGIRVDSVVQENGYKRYVTFRTARGWKAGTGNSQLADSNGACWLGKNVRAYANGDWHFPNVAGDTILVKTGAKAGDTWSFHRDTSAIWTEAKVLSIDTQTVFGVLDSVKRIQLTLKNGNVTLPSNSISSFQIVLSKTMGFAQVPDLYLFPYKDLDSAYAKRDFWYRKLRPNNSTLSIHETLVFSNIAGWNPSEREMYSFQAGDITYAVHGYNGFWVDTFLDTVLTRQDFPNYTEYTYNRWTWRLSFGGNGTSSLTINNGIKVVQINNSSLFDTVHIPEEYYGYNGCYQYLYLDYGDTSFCKTGLLIQQKDKGYECGLYVGGGSSRTDISYKKGLGLVHYHYTDGDGQNIYRELRSYSKNGVPCGTIPAVPSGIEKVSPKSAHFKIYPQPATTHVYLQAPQLRYPATIRIQNLQGQLLFTQQLSAASKPISTANLPAGLYLLSVQDAGGNSSVQKLLIEAN